MCIATRQKRRVDTAILLYERFVTLSGCNSVVKSYLDIFKRGILLSFLWITLAIVFLAGTNRVNIFSIGYLIGAFIFLWHGSDFYLRPIPKILRQWQWLLAYNVTVIFLKAFFQILGCIVVHQIPFNCSLVQLFGIGCVRKFGDLDLTNIDDDNTSPKICKVPREFTGIAWDGICFGLLIIQRRIFNSYNFFHMVDETKATTILASRGAELIEEMRLKTMTDQEELEHQILDKIKQKMDRIKANQQKIQNAGYKDRPQLGRGYKLLSSDKSCICVSWVISTVLDLMIIRRFGRHSPAVFRGVLKRTVGCQDN
ncbi:hypothetical protein NQ315_003645 [Exocentrus adspersus]|uniref:Piezo TM25-28 domain-containing protein n=1 Tax=Exocentrus adspersus TaxID=1586481 RepID=A0AAV8VC63_9CUCU|nr:hypothetical protein NQ315_003645 [Exocentrus adspersus]